jgi:hypothetical protein
MILTASRSFEHICDIQCNGRNPNLFTTLAAFGLLPIHYYYHHMMNSLILMTITFL